MKAYRVHFESPEYFSVHSVEVLAGSMESALPKAKAKIKKQDDIRVVHAVKAEEIADLG